MIRWFSDVLGFPFITECETGMPVCNEAASQYLKPGQNRTLVETILEVLGYDINESVLQEGVSQARSGLPFEHLSELGDRILFFPAEENRASAVVVFADHPELSSIQKSENQKLSDSQSHELANALGAIVGWTQLAKEGNRVQEAIELIEKASSTAWIIARKMLGHQDPLVADDEPQVIDLSKFIDEAILLVMPSAKRFGITIHPIIEPDLYLVCKRDAIWSIVWNPLTNAIEAMPNGGNIWVSAARISNILRLVVEDDGPGMDAEMKEKVVQPYFTTKKQGTGLGLALVKESASSIGGTLRLEDRANKGTCIVIELPYSAGVQQQAEDKKSKTPRSSGVYRTDKISGRILIVDDDAALREMMATALELRGASVVAVDTSSQALATKGSFDLALIDMQLPDQSGDTLLAKLYALKKVRTGIIVTGHNFPNGPQGKPAVDILRKPFQLETLFERVAKALALIDQEEVIAI